MKARYTLITKNELASHQRLAQFTLLGHCEPMKIQQAIFKQWGVMPELKLKQSFVHDGFFFNFYYLTE